MGQAIAEFLVSFSASQPIWWMVFVLAVVAGAGVALYFVWEVLLKLALGVRGRSPQQRDGR